MSMRRGSFNFLKQLAAATKSHQCGLHFPSVQLALHAANSASCFHTVSGKDASCCMHRSRKFARNVFDAWNGDCSPQWVPQFQHRFFAARHTRSPRVEAAIQRQNKNATCIQHHAASSPTGADTPAEGEPNVIAADTSATKAEVANVVRHPGVFDTARIMWPSKIYYLCCATSEVHVTNM